MIWNQNFHFNTQFDESYPARKEKTLSDGLYGTKDYSFNWLLFNNTSMDVELTSLHLLQAKTVNLNFLNDPAHYIFLPKTIRIFQGTDSLHTTLIKEI